MDRPRAPGVRAGNHSPPCWSLTRSGECAACGSSDPDGSCSAFCILKFERTKEMGIIMICYLSK